MRVDSGNTDALWLPTENISFLYIYIFVDSKFIVAFVVFYAYCLQTMKLKAANVLLYKLFFEGLNSQKNTS